VLNFLTMFPRYAVGLRKFLQQPLTPAECRRRIEHHLRERDEYFLRLVERRVFAHAGSPYFKLLNHFGIGFEDIAKMVRRHGVEPTLERLYDEGVYVTYQEFKGRQPIIRRGLEFRVKPKDFDNPLLAKHYEARTGGSRSVGTRVVIDFDLLSHEAAYYHLFLTAFDLAVRPLALWFPVPPGSTGIKTVLRYAKLGKAVERWFSQNKFVPRLDSWKYFLFSSYAVYSSRIGGLPLPVPEYVPLAEASQVALWLAAKKMEGKPAVLYTYVSSGIRVCLAARELGLDISGSLLRLAGEPYTPAKARVVSEAGCKAACEYSMAEIGCIGILCANPSAPDDVHVTTDKLAVIQRDRPVGSNGRSIPALCYTTLLPSTSKIMLNVESGDYGVLGERRCGCLVGEIGFSQHLHSIRSYDKLTSEGMTFGGSDLISLVEDILPARFGGHPTDYQLVEEEEAGLSKVSLIVGPRVGPVDEKEIVSTLLTLLRSYPGLKMMAEQWRDGRTLRVVRREPYATGVAKVLPLHILKNG